MKHSHWWFGSVYSHMSLKVSFGSKGSRTNSTFEGAFSRMSSVVHLKG